MYSTNTAVTLLDRFIDLAGFAGEGDLVAWRRPRVLARRVVATATTVGSPLRVIGTSTGIMLGETLVTLAFLLDINAAPDSARLRPLRAGDGALACAATTGEANTRGEDDTRGVFHRSCIPASWGEDCDLGVLSRFRTPPNFGDTNSRGDFITSRTPANCGDDCDLGVLRRSRTPVRHGVLPSFGEAIISRTPASRGDVCGRLGVRIISRTP